DLVFGWISFLRRTATRISIRWDGLAVFAITLFGIVIIAHFLLRGRFRGLRMRIHTAHPPWWFRSTVILTASFMLAFVAGISFVGAAHQLSWLSTAPTPLFGHSPEMRWSDSRSNLKSFGRA